MRNSKNETKTNDMKKLPFKNNLLVRSKSKSKKSLRKLKPHGYFQTKHVIEMFLFRGHYELPLCLQWSLTKLFFQQCGQVVWANEQSS